MSVSSILDREFYEKVVIIGENARLIAKKELPLDIDTHHTYDNAVVCFFQKQYLATVFFSSIGVERYLNQKLGTKKWKCLNGYLIKKAYDSSIKAVTELLDDSEKNVLLKGKPKPLFCERRNKILHGDIEGLLKIKAPEVAYVKNEIERDREGAVISFLISAYDQLLKFQKFLLKT